MSATEPVARVPTRDDERLYRSFASLFLSITTFAAAAWVFMIGSVLPYVGDTRLAIVGLLCGMALGSLACALGAALPAFRYGIDSIDVSKACLGPRGSLLPMAGLLLTAIAWAAVLAAMVARGSVSLVAEMRGASGAWSEPLALTVYLLMLVLCYFLLRRGYEPVQRANNLVGPVLLAISALCLALLLYRFGPAKLWNTNVAPELALTTDRRESLSYALEFGMAMALAWWPYIGGLHRLVVHRRHTVHPLVLGTLCGGGFGAIVAALAAVHEGSADPVIWILRLAGPVAGPLIVATIFVMNVPALTMLAYFSASSLQQFDWAARLRWDRLVLLVLAAVAFGAWNSAWVVTHVVGIASYGGLVFLGLAAISTVDFFVLRRQRLAVDELLAPQSGGRYGFWGGVNWVAMAVVALSVVAYLSLYDPISLQTAPWFRYFGAGPPVFLASGALYYILMRLIALPAGRGGYR